MLLRRLPRDPQQTKEDLRRQEGVASGRMPVVRGDHRRGAGSDGDVRLPPEERCELIVTASVGGDSCPGELATRWSRRLRLLNCYGPTEATIYATVLHLNGAFAKEPPIGRPVGGTKVRLLDRSGIAPDDLVIEIGPGRGIITGRLATRCRQVLAVEKDPLLVEELRSRFADAGNVALFASDFLHFPLPLSVREARRLGLEADKSSELARKSGMLGLPPSRLIGLAGEGEEALDEVRHASGLVKSLLEGDELPVRMRAIALCERARRVGHLGDVGVGPSLRSDSAASARTGKTAPALVCPRACSGVPRRDANRAASDCARCHARKR